MMTVLAPLTLWALAATAQVSPTAPPPPSRLSASAQVLLQIVRGANIRGGRTDEPHQRRRTIGPEGQPLTVLEFE